MEGLEPSRSYLQRILSPLRLPIPPRPHHLWRFRSDLNWWSQSCSLLPYHLATEPFRWLPIYNTSTHNKKQEKNLFFLHFFKNHAFFIFGWTYLTNALSLNCQWTRGILYYATHYSPASKRKEAKTINVDHNDWRQ